MKKNIIIILTILSVLTFNSFSHDGENHSSEHRLKLDYKASVGTVDPNGEIIRVNVKGLVCDFCARGISKTFKKDENVKKISIDLKNGKVVIAYQNDYKISFDDIKEKMLENGINAVKMEIINI